MHVEKNVCENIIWTICGEKDNKEVRWDLEGQNICPHLWLIRNSQNPVQWIMPHANYVMSEKELSVFQNQFASLKVPSDYSTSLAKHVSTKRWASMKAHDWHVLIQHLLLLCLRGLVQKNTQKTIVWVSRVFWRTCGKTINPNEMLMFKEDVATTLCMLEMEIPLFFFDVMTHLMIHLIEKIDVFGLVHTKCIA